MLQPPMTIASPAAASRTHQRLGLPLTGSASDADAPTAPGISFALLPAEPWGEAQAQAGWPAHRAAS